MATKNKQIALYLDDEMERELRRGVGLLQLREGRYVSAGDFIRRAIVFFLAHELRTTRHDGGHYEATADAAPAVAAH